MVDVTAQLAQAAQRAQAAGLPYAGAVTPEEAHTLLNALHNAVLVDVRTQAEWNFVGGVPGASGTPCAGCKRKFSSAAATICNRWP